MLKHPEKYKQKVEDYIKKYALIDNSRKISEASTKADFDEEDDLEEDFFWSDSASIDEDNLIEFLNEYYIVKPDKLPKPELI